MTQPAEDLYRLDSYIAWHAARTPKAEALVLGAQRWTYGDLHARIQAAAKALLGLGVARGDRVATLQTPHPDYVVAFLATAAIGAIWVGLNPKYRVEELKHVLTDSRPVVLLTRTVVDGRSYGDDLAALRAACPSLVRAFAFADEPAVDGVEPWLAFEAMAARVSDGALAAAQAVAGGRDPCLIVYTSGSTGQPKGALLHHEGIGRFSRTQNEVWPVSTHRILNYFPVNHIGCVVDVTFPALVAGGTVVFMEHFDPRGALAIMAKERVTIWGSVPSVYQMQLALPDFETFDLSAVELILWEGAAMPEETIRRLLELGRPLATNYGMTETTSAITVTAPTRDLDVLAFSVGVPFPGVELRLAGPDGEPVAQGEPGEVWCRSPYNLLGYWGRPEATEAAFSEGYFRTGDLAAQRPDGRIRIVGRLKEMYKSGGYNVYPREIEAVLETHPAVVQAAVVSRPDPLWQEVGVAYVAAEGAVTPEELAAWCRARLANYKCPKDVFVESALPLLPIGKVDKTALQRRAREAFETV